ncbi:MAG: hypothetical protein IKY96_01790 [Oscillospiraceae bacterium]|nr:hypothetical protein [Oscillospiraceae bacterium]
MSRRKSNKTPIMILLVLVILAAGLLGGIVWFINTHFFVGGRPYANDAQALDLRGQKISLEEYRLLRERLPEAELRWDVPFQGTAHPDDTTGLSIQTLSDEDLDTLAYFRNLKTVDATGCREYAQIQKLKERCPDVSVKYTVFIGGKEYPHDAQKVVASELTDDEIALMAYLPDLKAVDASACRNYEQIGKLMAQHPELELTYQVELLGKTYTEADTSATFDDPDVNALMEQLAWLPNMEKVHLGATTAGAQSLQQLVDAYPHIAITWEKTVFGKTFNSAETEYDLSDSTLAEVPYGVWNHPMDQAETARITQLVEEAMAYFPNAEKVILPACYFHNETMSAFREKMRPEYKVVWTVYVTKKPVRTDQEIIHSSAYKVCFIDELSQDLVYCEDAIVVDIGHSYVKDISWVKGMPKLKYLILAHNWVRDITPLSTCKNLVYLELFWNGYIPDFTPLLECTALEDLNVSGTPTDMTPLYQMTWLKNLWANCKGISAAEDEALREALPNTTIMTRGGDYTTGGWREIQGYYDMRDFMGLPYNHW